MVNVGHCIDSTEVTQAQYKVFLDAKGSDTSGQPSSCASNTSYVPITTDSASCVGNFNPSGTPNRPVACVNWCDATAYCKWAGKRLCGAIGGGPGGFADISDASKNQWYKACSQNGATTYPYGNTFINFCNTDKVKTATMDVGVNTTCTGTSSPYSIVFDMSGNVMEWVDTCLVIAGDPYCQARGGSYDDDSPYAQCLGSKAASVPPLLGIPTVGFRCCGP